MASGSGTGTLRGAPLGALLAAALLAGCSTTPAGPAAGDCIRLDGRVTEPQWPSRPHAASAGGQVRVLRGDARAFVSIADLPSDGWGFGVLFVARAGEVHVLHASAQLGSARYRPRGALWDPQAATYDWQSATRMLAAEGWAADVATGDGSRGREFVLDARHLAQARIALAYVVQQGEGRLLTVWPPEAADDIRNIGLIEGSNPAGLRFDPSSWRALDEFREVAAPAVCTDAAADAAAAR